METSKNILKMLKHKISVPDYQRAYSWEVEKHIATFINDLNNHINSNTKSNYYFGHFLFEETGEDDKYNIIDGQQRATTIIICLSALFSHLCDKDKLSSEEETIFEDLIKRKNVIKFSTVKYDNQNFIDYIIEKNKKNNDSLNVKTNSARRFIKAYTCFYDLFKDKNSNDIRNILNCIIKARCTTHIVTSSSDAIQMFIFQNDRGKKPTHLEILKSKFMFNIYLYAKDNSKEFLDEITTRFEKIYICIAQIDNKLDEDDVLRQAYKFYKNSLNANFDMKEIDKELEKKNDSLNFIKEFSLKLETTFEAMKKFHDDEKNDKIFEAHSLISLGRITLAYPFIVKSYVYETSEKERKYLFHSLEQIIFRHRIIGTRADLERRLNGSFQAWRKDNNNVENIIKGIEYLKSRVKKEDKWHYYWHNDRLREELHGWINHKLACWILWKYENYIEKNISNGYAISRYDKVEKPELEHIAPQTENGQIASGYNEYDEEFINEYIDCLGNYLLISKSHNCAIGNEPFEKKCASYKALEQQRRVITFCDENKIWNKKSIDNRHNDIVDFIIKEL